MTAKNWFAARVWVLGFCILGAAVPVAHAQSFSIAPGQGVSFQQVDFNWDSAPSFYTDTAQVNVDFDSLASSTGMSSGYLNIATPEGWAVQNLPVFDGATFPFDSGQGFRGFSSGLGLPTPAGAPSPPLNAFVQYSASPITSFSGGPMAPFAVDSGPNGTSFNGQGDDGATAGGTPAKPSAPTLNFQLGGLFKLGFQFGHQNVQAADNQCAPAAVANSLQWLKDSQGIPVPHQNIMGLRGNPANSLVGQLDLTMGRTARDRRDGDATPRMANLQGKLRYVAANNLSNQIVTKHESTVFGGQNVADPGGSGLLSYGQGTRINPDWILSELQHGEDVEMCYSYANPPGGGHCVELVGGGKILGVPWIAHRSDHNQADDTKGTGGTDFGFLQTQPDGSLKLVGVLGGDTATIGMVVSQSRVPEPGTASLLACVFALSVTARRRPNRSV